MVKTFRFTTSRTPCLFVLYPGVDPTSWVEELGKDRGVTAENGSVLQNYCGLFTLTFSRF